MWWRPRAESLTVYSITRAAVATAAWLFADLVSCTEVVHSIPDVAAVCGGNLQIHRAGPRHGPVHVSGLRFGSDVCVKTLVCCPNCSAPTEGVPAGRRFTLGGVPCYVVEPRDRATFGSRALLLIPDATGVSNPQIRLLAGE